MPYTKATAPDRIKDIPVKAQEIWIAAYNSAYDDYDPDKVKADSKEAYANSVAWAAIKKAGYQKKDDKWVLEESMQEKLFESIDAKLKTGLDEAGKRNNKKDEDRLKGIQKLVGELLSDVQAEIKTEGEAGVLIESYNAEITTMMNEWYGGNIAGSDEDKKDKLQQELRKIKKFQITTEGSFPNAIYSNASIMATFKDYVICSWWGKNEVDTYWKISYVEDETGQIVFSEPVQIELKTIIKTVNEAKWIDEKFKTKLTESKRKPHQINEILTLKEYQIINEEKDERGKTKSLKIRVPVAQEADKVNENNRLYSADVLRESVLQQQKLSELNSLTMYDTHPKDGKSNVSTIIGKINQINYNEESKTISLDEVEFIPTSTGRDCIEVIKAGIPLQVSQRAEGHSTTKSMNGKPVQIVESLQVFGYDLLPPGQAGVQNKGNAVQILESKKEVLKMDITQEQLDEMIQKQSQAIAEGLIKASQSDMQSKMDEQKKQLDEITAEKQAIEQAKINKVAVEERIAVADFKWSRFNPHQQKVILEGLEYTGTKEQVYERMDKAIKMMDTTIASVKLQERGIGRSSSGSFVNVEVGVSSLPGQERITKLSEATKSLLQMDEAVKPSARTTEHSKAVLENFARINERALLNEADTMGAGNLPTVTQYSAVVIEQAFQLITSLDLCDIGTMNSSPNDVFLENYSENPKANVNALKVAQGGTMAKAALVLSKFPLYSEVLKLRVGLYEEALVAAKSANNYDIEARSIVSLVKDFSRRKDLFVYGLMLAKSDCYDTGKVTANETLTQVGTTTKWYSIHGGLNYLLNSTNVIAKANRHHMWVKNEFIKKFDVNNNLASTYLALAGTDTTSTLQAVVVVDNSATPKTLVYGYLQSDDTVRVTENDLTSALADYYVLYPDGAIVISDNPVTPGLTLTAVKAKYTYTKNARVWMATPPAGVTFESHLKELHLLTGQVKTQLIGSRYWIANFLAASTSTADMLSNSILYQQAGSNAANTMGADGWIERFAGFSPTKSAIIPDDRLIVGVKGAIAVRNHVPYRIEGPIRTIGIAESEYQALETEGTDCFIPSKLATVGIGQ